MCFLQHFIASLLALKSNALFNYLLEKNLRFLNMNVNLFSLENYERLTNQTYYPTN